MIEKINDALAYHEAKRESNCRRVLAGHKDNAALRDPIERSDIIEI